MKQWIVACLLLPFGVAAQQITYQVEGKLTGGLTGKYAFMQIFAMSQQQKTVYQKAAIQQGQFVFSGKAEAAGSGYRTARIFITDKAEFSEKDVLPELKKAGYFIPTFMLESKVGVAIGKNSSDVQVAGSSLNTVYREMEQAQGDQVKESQKINADYDQEIKQAGTNKQEIEKLKAEQMQKIWQSQEAALYQRLQVVRANISHPHSLRVLSMSAAQNKSMSGKYQAIMEEIWELLPAKDKNSATGKRIRTDIDAANATLRLGAGSAIPDYTFRQENGESVSLKDYKGKYLLLDFWTSWCTPCRREHYYMKQAYQKYKSKGLEILQVSMDESKAKWLKALKEDELPWLNVLHVNGWDKKLEELFNFTGVPATFLISPEGKIIARNLKGEALEKQLAALLH